MKQQWLRVSPKFARQPTKDPESSENIRQQKCQKKLYLVISFSNYRNSQEKKKTPTPEKSQRGKETAYL